MARVAVITGGASGIGLGLATAFARAGLRVVILDIEQAAVDSAIRGLADEGLAIEGYQVDVTDLAAMRAVASRIAATHGAVHLLCNNAGVTFERKTEDWTDIGWTWVHAVNVLGVVHGVQAFLPLMPAQAGACIVNTSSVVGLIGGVPGLGQYVATKFALVGLSQSLRSELAPKGIQVALLCPGQVASNIRQSERNAPPAVQARLEDAPLAPLSVPVGSGGMIAPATIGEMVLAGIADGRFYIVTDPAMAGPVVDEWEAAQRDFDWSRAFLESAQA